MAEEEKKATSNKQTISADQRFRYIGFEVFPHKPKDLFKSEAEKQKLVDAIKAKRESGESLREECTLLESRVSMSDRIIATIACLVMFASIFIPWYSAYNEVVQESHVASAEAPADSLMQPDSLALAAAGDSSEIGVAIGYEEPPAEVLEEDTGEPPMDALEENPGVASTSTSSNEEVIHGYIARKKITKEYERLSGIGSFAALGSVGPLVFGSGFAAAVIAIALMIVTILSIFLPVYTLYGLYGFKGTADERALKLKKILRLNWLPLLLFLLTVILSFFGGDYGFDPTQYFDSLGKAFGPVSYFDTLSWGVFVSVAMSLLVALKGVEI
ncbi:MAG TPA: hypothetical protein PLF13_07930 [candidate division Zixibacteria bacterium]|nr:hypothetical protein [candidate division Zixibacteria bacterium]